MLVKSTAFFIVGMIAVTLVGCAVRKDKGAAITTGVVNLGPASDFPAGAVNTNFLARYGVVVANKDGTPLVILARCTHDGATLKWNAEHNEFVCPNDGSRFDILGRVENGPAAKDLKGVVPERQADGTLAVDLSKLYGN